MAEKVIYKNIYKAIEILDPRSPILWLRDTDDFFLCNNTYEIMAMGDGQFAAVVNMPGFQLFRGEYRDYGACMPSIYRGCDADDIIIDELRIIEFSNILKTFPQVQYAIEAGFTVDYLALAQHYGLRTNLLDFTVLSPVAAFFATQRYHNGEYVPVGTGVGTLSVTTPPLRATSSKDKYFQPFADSFHMIGLQCFQRPGLQGAVGIEFGPDKICRPSKIYFHQVPLISLKINMNFHFKKGKFCKGSWLFPEEEIAEVAKQVKNSQCISQQSVIEYGKPCEEVLRKKDIHISLAPVYCLPKSKRIELEDKYSSRPFGDVRLEASLSAKPLLRKE